MSEEVKAKKTRTVKKDKEIEELKAQVEQLLKLNKEQQLQKASSIQPSRDGELVFDDNVVILHHLFKADTQNMKKNLSWNTQEAPQHIEDTPHVHYFHTVDSSGRKQTYTSPVGGHFHKVEIEDQGPGKKPKILSVGPALEYKVVRRNGKSKKIVVPVKYRVNKELEDGSLLEWAEDKHTHDLTYLKSDKIQKQKLNSEALTVISKEAAKYQKPSDLAVKG